MKTNSNGLQIRIGDKVQYEYSAKKLIHTGVVIEFKGRTPELARIEVDAKWHHENSGSTHTGTKMNSIPLDRIEKIIKEGTMEEQNTKIVVGSKVIIRSKEDLLAEFGADAAGNPKTVTKFNSKGLMDHYYGATAIVEALNEERGLVRLEFTDKEPDKEYGWTVSLDTLVLDDGSYMATVLSAEPVRDFMKNNDEPTSKQVWTALNTLKKKLKLEDGVVVFLFQIFENKGIEGLRNVVEYTPDDKFKGVVVHDYIEKMSSYYGKLNTEVFILMDYYVLGNRGTVMIDLLTNLTAMKTNEKLAVEMTDTPFTPFKRQRILTSIDDVNSVWEHLEIKDSFQESGDFSTERDIASAISSKIVAFLNDAKKIRLEEGDIITLGE